MYKRQKGKEEQEVYLSVPSDLEKNKEFQVFRNRITKKEFELEKNSVILTEKAAQLLDVEKGDKIVLEDKDEDVYKRQILKEIKLIWKFWRIMDIIAH